MSWRRGSPYHNAYGPNGTDEGGREKAPAICRKVIEAKLTGRHGIEIWSTASRPKLHVYRRLSRGRQQQIMQSTVYEPLNLGCNQLVTINRLVDMVEASATSWTPAGRPVAQQRQYRAVTGPRRKDASEGAPADT